MNTSRFSVLSLLMAMLLWGCNPKDDESVLPDSPPYEKGILISCEGPFQTGTGTVSFIHRETNELVNDVFMKENGRPLGNIVQSVFVWNGKIYIVVNNAAKVEIANAATFKSMGVINGLTSPRFFVGASTQKAYISDWSNNILVINLVNNSIQKSIPCGGRGPERMLIAGNRLFVLNSGGWSTDNLLTVIDIHNDVVADTIRIGDRPTGIVTDKNNMLWILCSGNGFNGWPQPDDTKGRLLRLNPLSMQIDKNLVFPETDKHPEHLTINAAGDRLFYTYPGGIYDIPINADVLPTTPYISTTKFFYSLAFDPYSGHLLAADPLDFAQEGWVYRYLPPNTAPADSFRVGVIPGNFFFVN